jgi:hypothetical protein
MESGDKKRGGRTDLPAGIGGETGDLHAVRRAAGARRSTLTAAAEAIALLVSSGKLDGQTFTHEIGSVWEGGRLAGDA